MAQRGRKKGSDGETSRALLLQIAADEFAENGYWETKISSIVQKANVTQPTFYLYFKSKEAIFKELEDLFQAKLALLAIDSLLSEQEEPSLSKQLEERLSAIFQFFTDNPSLGRIGFYISPIAVTVKAQLADQLEHILLQKAEAGYIDSHLDMSIVAHGIIGMIEQLSTTKLWTGEKTAVELGREIAAVIFYGLKKK